MGKYPRKRRLGTEQRQALDLLAGDPHGATEELGYLTGVACAARFL
jgi:hypothetical protein